METDKNKHEKGVCPACGRPELDYGEVEVNNDLAFYEWACTACGAEGKEHYKLVFQHHTLNNEGE